MKDDHVTRVADLVEAANAKIARLTAERDEARDDVERLLARIEQERVYVNALGARHDAALALLREIREWVDIWGHCVDADDIGAKIDALLDPR